jgi:hypothetical protein
MPKNRLLQGVSSARKQMNLPLSKSGMSTPLKRQLTSNLDRSRKASNFDSENSSMVGTSSKLVDPFLKSISYVSEVDGDIIDKMLENFIRTHKVKVPIHRID